MQASLNYGLNQNFINALNSIYYVMYEIDLEKETCREIVTVPVLRDALTDEGNARELLQTIHSKFCKPEYRSRLEVFLDLNTFAKRLEKNKVLTYEYRAVTVPWALVSVLPLEYGADGKLKSVIFAVRDISDIKEKDSQYQNLIQALAAPYNNLYTINMADGSMQIQHMEGNIRESYGYAVSNMGYEKALELYIESEVYKDDKELFNPIRTVEGCRKIFEGAKEYLFKYRIVRDGKLHYYAAQIVKPSEERDEFALGFRNVDDEVSAQESQKRALEEQMAVVSGLASDYFSVMLVDYQADKVTVRTAKEGSGKLIGNFFSSYSTWSEGLKSYIDTQVVDEDREVLAEALSLEAIRSNDKNFTVNYQKLTDNGIIHMIVKVAYVESMEGRPLAVIGTRSIEDEFQRQIKLLKIQEEYARVQEEARKLQEAKNVELLQAKAEAEAANMAKTSFLFNMSHDIRTPMNAIIGFRNLLEKHQENPERRADYLEKIGESSNVLLSIINNVLEMARIEKGTIELDESAWSAEQFNDTLYSLFHELMTQKGIAFTRVIDVKNNYVFCDPVKLREVFNNILSNAYKYTASGGRIQMYLKEIPSNREGYAVYQTTITDTGIGMSEEFLPHLFDEFSREQNTTLGKVEGTGLGMSIVKKLTELMDGTISVQSEKGVGTTFTVTIPHRIAVKSDLWDHSNMVMNPEQFSGKRILLAEDVDLNAEIAMEILGDAGFVVERAVDGLDCLNKLKASAAGYYDLVLMDIQMPKLNGYEAAKAIRALEDEVKSQVKIIAVTANAFEEDKREALRCGMNGHLAKPIDVHELMKVLTRVLQ